MNGLAEKIAAEVMDTIERERRVNKDDIIAAASKILGQHYLESRSNVHVGIDPAAGPDKSAYWPAYLGTLKAYGYVPAASHEELRAQRELAIKAARQFRTNALIAANGVL